MYWFIWNGVLGQLACKLNAQLKRDSYCVVVGDPNDRYLGLKPRNPFWTQIVYPNDLIPKVHLEKGKAAIVEVLPDINTDPLEIGSFITMANKVDFTKSSIDNL